ncbi:MAG: molybdopterin cofactor-binding domain-containing protein [Acidimicrobiales bacterium]
MHLDADMGAYMMLITPGAAAWQLPYTGVYECPAFGFTCDGHFTNPAPTDAYRGPVVPEASYAIERAMDMLAAKVGVGPDEIRRRNYLAGEAFEKPRDRADACSTLAITPNPTSIELATASSGPSNSAAASRWRRQDAWHRPLQHLRRDLRPSPRAERSPVSITRWRLGARRCAVPSDRQG